MARLSKNDAEFVSELRRRADHWSTPLIDTWVEEWEDDTGEAGVLAGLHFDGLSGISQVFAAAVVGTGLHCGPVHADITYFFKPWSPGLVRDAYGTPRELADIASEWFLALQVRPVMLSLWLNDGTVYAGRYEYADSGDLIQERYERQAAPDGEPESMVARGYTVGKHIVTTEGLGDPHAFVFIRGDRDSARIPADVPEYVLSDLDDSFRYGFWPGCERRRG